MIVYLATERKPRSVFYDCLGHLRPFEIVLENREGEEVIRFSRPFRCQGCMFPCFKQEMKVSKWKNSLPFSLTFLVS